MHTFYLLDRWNREQTAHYFHCAKDTLAVWDSLKRYNLNPQKVGKYVYYKKVDIEKFMGASINGPRPLMHLNKAASYINISPHSLSNKVFSKRHGLQARKIGWLVRYCPYELDRHLENQLRPIPLAI